MKIMFVCTGNICRSPLAEAVFRALIESEGLDNDFQVDSSGTTAYHVGQAADERMRAVAAAHGVTIRHRSRQLRGADLESFDLILAMDRSNLRDIARIASNGVEPEKIRLLREFDPEGGANAEVPDPYYGGQRGFETVYGMVDRASRGLLAQLRDRLPASST